MKKLLHKIILFAFTVILICIVSNSYGQTYNQTFSGQPVQVNTWRGGESFDSFLRLPFVNVKASNLDSCGRLYFDRTSTHAMYVNNCTGMQQVFTMADTALLRSILGGGGSGADSSVFVTISRLNDSTGQYIYDARVVSNGSNNIYLNYYKSNGNIISLTPYHAGYGTVFDNFGNIGIDTTLIVNGNRLTDSASSLTNQFNRSITSALASITFPLPQRIQFMTTNNQTSYTNTTLIGDTILSVSLNGELYNGTGPGMYTFNSTTGTITFTSAVPVNQQCVILYNNPYGVLSTNDFVTKSYLLKTISSYNLFTGAIYGSYWQNTNGTTTSYAPAARTDKIPVQPNTSYSESGTTNGGAVILFKTDGSYDTFQTVTAVTGGYTFTTHANTGYVGINLTFTGQTGFDSTFQLNTGAFVLPYQSPSYTNTYINPSLLSNNPTFSQVDSLKKMPSGSLWVYIDTPNIYLRSYSDTAHDLVVRLLTGSSTGHPFRFNESFFIPHNTPDLTAAVEGSLNYFIDQGGDDACPVNYNGTYIAGDHGPDFAVQLTSTAHGKTNADIGSKFYDNINDTFYLIRIVDANTLWFISQNKAIGTQQWKYTITASGSSLTYVSGGSSTSNVSFSSQLTTQIFPYIQSQTLSMKIDTLSENIVDAQYHCSQISFINTYNVPDLPSAVSWVIANQNSDFTNPAIAAGTTMSLQYTFDPYGGCTTSTFFKTLKPINLNYVGGSQAQGLYGGYTNDSIYQKVDNTLPYTVGSRTYNYWYRENITGNIDDFQITKSYWADTTRVPAWLTQRKENAGTPVVNFGIGYSPLFGIGSFAKHKSNIQFSAADIYTSKKLYPHAIDFSNTTTDTLARNSYLTIVSFRSYTNPADHPNAFSTGLNRDVDGSWILHVDYNQNVVVDGIKLPSALNGYIISTIDSSSHIQCLSSIVDNNSAFFTTNSTDAQVHEYMVLKLVKPQ